MRSEAGFCYGNGECLSQLGRQPKLRESVEPYTDLTPLHSCTFTSLFSVLSCAFDHPSNAIALAQVVPQN